MKSPAPKNDKIVDEMGSGITGRIVACFLLVLTSVAFAMGGQDSGYVLAVLLDSEGNAWAGSEGCGLLCNIRDCGCWNRDRGFREKVAKSRAGYNAAWRYHCTYGNPNAGILQYAGPEEDQGQRRARE